MLNGKCAVRDVQLEMSVEVVQILRINKLFFTFENPQLIPWLSGQCYSDVVQGLNAFWSDNTRTVRNVLGLAAIAAATAGARGDDPFGLAQPLVLTLSRFSCWV